MTTTEAGRTPFSVVVPAHDEEGVLARCLGFVADLEPDEAQVVVAANGCSDGTVRIAASVPGVQVVDLPTPGKAGALNAGDAAVTRFPRVYLDADIVVSVQTLRGLADALAGPEPRLAAPRPRFDLTARPWAVRAFYRAYERLPYVSEGLSGLGVYAMSATGRRRFEDFPAVTADDLFTQRLFAPTERISTDDVFVVQTPRSLRALVAVRTRTAYGNRQLAGTYADEDRFAGTSDGTARALVHAVRADPRLAPDAAVYVAVVAIARWRAGRRGGGTWHRDQTTR